MTTLTRRDLMRIGLTAGVGAPLLSRAPAFGGSIDSILESSSGLVSPRLTPWVEELFIPAVAQPVSDLYPSCPAIEPARDWWSTYEHQRYEEFHPQKYYQIDVKPVLWSFHRNLPATPLFSYGGTVPGTMVHARYGEPLVVRFNNMLPRNHVGIGSPETAVHLHNMHTPSESDGFPGDFITPGNYRDNHYPMCRAGYDMSSGSGNGDYRESLGTLWFHDHRFNYTSQNVYNGLFGFFNAFDELDTGDENDTSSMALGLPSGPYDIQLAFTDPQFDSSGKIFFNVFDMDGHLGDKVAVNGKITPYLKVARRKYRFRLLDAGPSRFYQFYLSKGLPKQGNKSWLPMTLIGNDGNLLEAPQQVDNVLMSVANRMDVIVDFTKYKDGDEIYLVNRLEQKSGRGPTFKLMDPGVPVLKFIVAGSAPDSRPIPSQLRPLPRPSTTELSKAKKREWIFDRKNGAWTVNGELADIEKPSAKLKLGSSEVWNIKNNSGSWSHPVHIHFEEFQILSRNGAPPPAYEVSRKDVLMLRPNEEVKIFMRFRDFAGRYVMHCHNVVHEDHAMMVRFDLER